LSAASRIFVRALRSESCTVGDRMFMTGLPLLD